MYWAKNTIFINGLYQNLWPHSEALESDKFFVSPVAHVLSFFCLLRLAAKGWTTIHSQNSVLVNVPAFSYQLRFVLDLFSWLYLWLSGIKALTKRLRQGTKEVYYPVIYTSVLCEMSIFYKRGNTLAFLWPLKIACCFIQAADFFVFS